MSTMLPANTFMCAVPISINPFPKSPKRHFVIFNLLIALSDIGHGVSIYYSKSVHKKIVI